MPGSSGNPQPHFLSNSVTVNLPSWRAYLLDGTLLEGHGIVPEIVVAKRWQRILHNRIAARLRTSLIAYQGIIITTVPFHLPR